MAQVIDTSVFVDLERRNLPFHPGLVATPEEQLAMAAITVSELLVGLHLAGTPERKLIRERHVETVIAAVPIFPFDLTVARVHAELAAELSARGTVIGAHDLLIAATAVTHGCAVLTANVRDFSRVPGLEVRQPDW